MADAMLRVEAAGYLPILSVHDEVVCEATPDFGTLQDFERLMSETPAWGAGCPVAAEAWAGFRYRK
jgi:DNA polymerase